MRLSKSRFVTGLQCHRRLWWSVHERDAPELVPGAGQRALLDGGQRVGEVAREYVLGGVLIDRPHVEIDERVRDTQVALESGAGVIYEAAFVADETFVAVDILHRRRGGWTLYRLYRAQRRSVCRRLSPRISAASCWVKRRSCTRRTTSQRSSSRWLMVRVAVLMTGDPNTGPTRHF